MGAKRPEFYHRPWIGSSFHVLFSKFEAYVGSNDQHIAIAAFLVFVDQEYGQKKGHNTDHDRAEERGPKPIDVKTYPEHSGRNP